MTTYNQRTMSMKAKAHKLLNKHGDADMSYAELMQLLINNGIPKDIAEQVIAEYR